MTRRYVRVLDDGRVAIPTSIEFLLTIDELTAGVISACTNHGPHERRFTGRLHHHAQTGESYWDVADLAAARRSADAVGRGGVMTAIRFGLEAYGQQWTSGDDLTDAFPLDIARRRAGELWPDLDPTVGPFGRRSTSTDA
ncbi:MAG: hypothetical protein ACR2QO_21720 [Acidimicrobiales bacterium]